MTLDIAIIDYEMGNLKSIYKCLKHLNIEAKITDNPKIILDSDGVILPGVGAFGDAMMHLKAKNLIPVINQIVKDNKPLFGICLGLHLLYSKGFEMGEFEGLGIIEGEVIIFDKSKVDKAILYFEDENKQLIKINNSKPLLEHMNKLLDNQNIENEKFIVVMWEESGGHTLQILSAKKDKESNQFRFSTKFPVIADKYPVPALVLITELISRGHVISESIDLSIVGINRTIPATDQEKIKIMKNFEKNDKKLVVVGEHEYMVHSLSDNNNMIDIYQLKSTNSILYFRPSGTGPDVRFYIFGKVETHLEEIYKVMEFIDNNFKFSNNKYST